MTSIDPPRQGQLKAGKPGAPKRLPLANLFVAALVLLCVAGVIYLRTQAAAIDFALVNILTVFLGFVAVVAVVIRIAFWRTLPAYLRWTPMLLLVVTIGGLMATMRVDQVDGRLVPIFRPRWSPKPDQLLTRPQVETGAGAVDVTTTGAYDFPQFLGPQRDLSVTSVSLVQNWGKAPPRRLWRRPIGAGWAGFAAVNGFAITMEQRGAEELVTCYEVETGRPRWVHAVQGRHETVMGGTGPRCTPLIHEGRIYVLGATGILRCLDGATGEPLWMDDILARYDVTPEADLKAVAWGRSASPLIVDDLVIVPFGGPAGGQCFSLAAYDKKTGELKWKGGDRQVSYSSPVLAVIAGIRQIVCVNEDNVSGHRPGDGQVIWSHEWPGGSASSASVSQAVVVPGDRILLSKGYGIGAELIGLSSTDGQSIQVQSVWKSSRVLKTKFTNVIARDGVVYGLSDGIMECVDLDTGKRLWKDRRRGDFGHGQILAVGDVLLAQAEDGAVVMLDVSPQRCVELGRIEALAGKTWNNLCLYGPYLLARNATEATCYQLDIEPPAPSPDGAPAVQDGPSAAQTQTQQGAE